MHCRNRLHPLKATFGLLSAFVLTLTLLTGCDSKPETVQLGGATMGTRWNVTVAPPLNGVDAAQLRAQIEQQLAEINQAMSTYIDTSELSQLNRAPVGEWIAVSPELHEVLLTAMEVGWLTGGAFDVTVGPLVDLWGFGPAGRVTEPPSDEALAAAMEQVGIQHVELNLAKPLVRRDRPVRIDLSGVAKGYGVDKIAELLQQQGLTNFLVEIGGELRLSGASPRGDNWRIAVERPDALPGQAQLPISLTDAAIATSGDYRNYFEQDGQRYSHTIDPSTGRPITHALASVTVIADNAAYADALATALEVLGAERALQLAEQLGLAVYVIVRKDDGFVSHHSTAFEPYLAGAQTNSE